MMEKYLVEFEREACARILEEVANCYADPVRVEKCRYAARVIRGTQDSHIREKIEKEMKDAIR